MAKLTDTQTWQVAPETTPAPAMPAWVSRATPPEGADILDWCINLDRAALTDEEDNEVQKLFEAEMARLVPPNPRCDGPGRASFVRYFGGID
jgi:hypothetical protein